MILLIFENVFCLSQKKVISCSGMFNVWNVRDVRCSECGMFGLQNVWDVGCSKCGMFKMWSVRDVGCWKYEMFRMWNVWWCGMFAKWYVRDVGCLGCEMFGVWDVDCGIQDVGCEMFAKMWDVNLQNVIFESFDTDVQYIPFWDIFIIHINNYVAKVLMMKSIPSLHVRIPIKS